MIKIFGKIRYHWQPELSILVIYWSLSFIPIFIGLSLMYESSEVPTLVLLLLFLFLILLAIGGHRYFTIYYDGTLRVISANPFRLFRIQISEIKKIKVTKTSITIVFFQQDEKKREQIYYMRKWPKKYFVDEVARNLHFRGEVVLTDNLIDCDYFEVYQGQSGNF